jgi:hypothetical protein
MNIDITQIKRFWLIHYFPAIFTRATWEERRRHSRVKLFLDPIQAALFADSVWHSRDWRLLSEVEVERTGLGFKHILPF